VGIRPERPRIGRYGKPPVNADCYGGPRQGGLGSAFLSTRISWQQRAARCWGAPHRTQAHLGWHLARLTAGGTHSADEHGDRQSVIRARSRRNGHQIIIRGSRRSAVPGESERCKTTRRPTAWWRPVRSAQALAVGKIRRRRCPAVECRSLYAAAALPSSNTASQRARSRTTRRRVTAMIARFVPVRGASRS